MGLPNALDANVQIDPPCLPLSVSGHTRLSRIDQGTSACTSLRYSTRRQFLAVLRFARHGVRGRECGVSHRGAADPAATGLGQEQTCRLAVNPRPVKVHYPNCGHGALVAASAAADLAKSALGTCRR